MVEVADRYQLGARGGGALAVLRRMGTTDGAAGGIFQRLGTFIVRWPLVVIGCWIALAVVLGHDVAAADGDRRAAADSRLAGRRPGECHRHAR